MNYKDANSQYKPATPVTDSFFTDVTQNVKTDFQHKETFFFDYGFQPLISAEIFAGRPFHEYRRYEWRWPRRLFYRWRF